MTESDVEVGNLSDVTIAGLSANGRWEALAALVLHHQDLDAANALAAGSATGEALVWLWRLATRQGTATVALQAFAHLPVGLRVPTGLRKDLQEYATRTPPGPPMQPRYPEDPERVAWPQFLAALDPADDFSLDIFRTVLGQGAVPTQAARAAAARHLSQDGTPDDLELALSTLADLTHAQRLEVLLAITHPYGDEVRAAAVAVVSLPVLPQSGVDERKLAQLASRLDVGDLVDLLTRVHGHQDRLDQLLGAGLVRQLGPDQTQQLLEGGLPEAVISRVLDAASRDLTGDQFDTFGAYAHVRFGDEHAGPFRQKVAQELRIADRRGVRGEDLRSTAIANFAALLFGSSSQAVAAELADSLRPGELAVLPPVTGAGVRQVGRVAGAVLRRDSADEFESEVRDLLEQAAANGDLPTLLEGLAEFASDDPPPYVVDAALSTDLAARPLVEAGLEGKVAAATTMHREPGLAAARVLCCALDLLSAQKRDHLVAMIRWPEVPEDVFSAVIGAVSANAAALGVLAVQSLDTLSGPEAAMVPTALVVQMLTAAAEAEAAGDLDLSASHDEALVALLLHPDDNLAEAAARLLANAEPTEPMVEGVIRADQRTSGRRGPLVALRESMARTLAGTASNPAEAPAARGSALLLAQRAGPAFARAVAFELATVTNPDLRTTAAEVLRHTPGIAEDLPRLVALAESEIITAVRESFEAAIRRISSGSTGEALHNLVTMLGLPAPAGSVERIVPPGTKKVDAFVKLADDTRNRYDRATADPAPFIDAAIRLADLLVDIALVATHDAVGDVPGLKAAQVELIRDNAYRRQDTGTLVTQQQLVQRFSWFPNAAGLRAFRDAHPAPLGTNSPVTRGQDEMIAARVGLEQIVQGWVGTMEALPAPS